MGFVGRAIAIVVMGAVLLALIGAPIATIMFARAASSPAEAPSVGWVFLVVALSVIAIASTAPTARKAWGRLFLVAALGSFALPLETIAASAGIGANLAASATNAVTLENAAAVQAGTITGAALAGGVMAGITGFVGFFLGLIFALCAFFTLRKA